jgi:L-iditol 2-dehydrogenase
MGEGEKMKALRFKATIPRYALGLVIGKAFPSFYWSGLSCTVFDEIPEPELPGEEWVLVKTGYGGICGSDMGIIHLHTSPYMSVYSSMPMVFGHENVGTIARVGSAVRDWREGERVVVEPLLWCAPRGFKELCPFCARGEINRCERVTQGELAAGLSIGACADTGGSWSPYFLAHQSQVYRVPQTVADENALMVEPLAVGVHAVLENRPQAGETILIIGGGTIGLVTLAALRALGYQNPVVMLARYPFQIEAARKLGAQHIIQESRHHDHLEELAELSGSLLTHPLLGRQVMIGGFDLVYECIGSTRSTDDALRATRAGGRVILLGMPGITKCVDLSPAFINELNIRGSYVYNHADEYEGEMWMTFDLVLKLLADGRLDASWMVTHKFKLGDYKTAFQTISDRARDEVLKAVFVFDDC